VTRRRKIVTARLKRGSDGTSGSVCEEPFRRTIIDGLTEGFAVIQGLRSPRHGKSGGGKTSSGWESFLYEQKKTRPLKRLLVFQKEKKNEFFCLAILGLAASLKSSGEIAQPERCIPEKERPIEGARANRCRRMLKIATPGKVKGCRTFGQKSSGSEENGGGASPLEGKNRTIAS